MMLSLPDVSFEHALKSHDLIVREKEILTQLRLLQNSDHFEFKFGESVPLPMPVASYNELNKELEEIYQKLEKDEPVYVSLRRGELRGYVETRETLLA
jgi:hypothetical protein